ncbi:S-layer homology domain-containing protein [Papillibacter cinnamivorans]|uniref:S-layer homology domain-containing protein n=1 Tax=Papillibacter cinnamivorans DSM 12816 TaxID=1122930 RepID=A0A1W2AGJ0_9FIRM|nr:S-layer homology domain-containing protein [Papillibacter cinnamivorans]SMC59829.1 S-layer homology domain-containing protein [Papillibacter cinnamivorans DSM 12816]
MNWRKTLCLFLACFVLAGTLGLPAQASGLTGYTDSEEIGYTQAVSLLTALGIVKGTGGGNFDPSAPVTRATMAKMVCVILSGGSDVPSAYVRSVPSFSDIKGHWAEGYIEFCAALGIVAGDGTGRFRPDEAITGTQAAKMLLVALGYAPAREGLTGTRWQLYTLIAAYSAGVFDGIDKIPSLVFTRDEAAQMIYNTLMNAKTVAYGDTGRQETQETLGRAHFGLAAVTGTVVENEYGSVTEQDATSPEGKTVLMTDAGNLFTLFASTGPEYLGRKITAYTENGDGGSLYGEPELSSENTEVTMTSAMTGTEVMAQLRSKGLILNSGMPLIVNCGGEAVTEVSDPDFFSNAAGEETSFVDNDGDGTVDYVLRMHRYVGVVTGYSASRGVISVTSLGTLGPSLSEADAWRVAGFDTVKKGDYILYYTVGQRVFVEPCASVEDTAEYRRGQAVCVGGNEYEQSSLVSAVDGTDTLTQAVTLNDRWILYLDRAGYVVAAEPAELPEQYLVVLDSNGGETITVFNPLRARLLLGDGTVLIAEISGIGGMPAGEENKALTGKTAVYRYTVDEASAYSLTRLSSGEGSVTAGNITELRAGRIALADGEDPVYAGSDTVFLVYAGGEAHLHRGFLQAPDLTGAVVCGVKSECGVAEFLFVTGGSPAERTGEDIIILDASPRVTLDKDGSVVYMYRAALNGEVTEIAASGECFGETGLYRAPVWAGGQVVSSGGHIAPVPAAVAGFGIVGTAEKVYLCGDEARVYAVDPETGTLKEISLEEIRTDGECADKIWIIPDPEEDRSALYVYVFTGESA